MDDLLNAIRKFMTGWLAIGVALFTFIVFWALSDWIAPASLKWVLLPILVLSIVVGVKAARWIKERSQ